MRLIWSVFSARIPFDTLRTATTPLRAFRCLAYLTNSDFIFTHEEEASLSCWNFSDPTVQTLQLLFRISSSIWRPLLGSLHRHRMAPPDSNLIHGDFNTFASSITSSTVLGQRSTFTSTESPNSSCDGLSVPKTLVVDPRECLGKAWRIQNVRVSQNSSHNQRVRTGWGETSFATVSTMVNTLYRLPPVAAFLTSPAATGRSLAFARCHTTSPKPILLTASPKL